jgi:hypothetical protein
MGIMTLHNALTNTGYQQPYRLVIKARTRTGPKKGYFWEIIRDNVTDNLIQQSSESYSTMEEAYDCGSVILRRTQSGP